MNTLFGERLKEMRKIRHLRQKDLSGSLGVSIDTVLRWEKGEREPKISELVKLAVTLKTSTAYLTGEVDNPMPTPEGIALEISNSSINGVAGVGNNNNVIHSSNGENESPVILVARVLDMIDKEKLKLRDMHVIHSMFKSGLEALESAIVQTTKG